jgi:hypothetical protein
MEFLDLGDSAPNDRYRFRYILTGGTYSDELLTTVPEGEETESESESEGEAPTEDITETPSDTDTETTAPVVNGSVDGSLSRVSFGSAAKGLWMIFLGADLLLAILIVCILIKNKKGSAV